MLDAKHLCTASLLSDLFTRKNQVYIRIVANDFPSTLRFLPVLPDVVAGCHFAPKCHRCSPSWNRNPDESPRGKGQESEHEAGEIYRLATKTGVDLQP